MNPIVFALRRPVTVMMLVLALALGGVYSIVRMQKDIFPSLNQPVLYVIPNYGGMDPKEIEGLITNQWPRFDGTERALAGNLDVLAESQPAKAEGDGNR